LIHCCDHEDVLFVKTAFILHTLEVFLVSTHTSGHIQFNHCANVLDIDLALLTFSVVVFGKFMHVKDHDVIVLLFLPLVNNIRIMTFSQNRIVF
jgi:hypothetical protein